MQSPSCCLICGTGDCRRSCDLRLLTKVPNASRTVTKSGVPAGALEAAVNTPNMHWDAGRGSGCSHPPAMGILVIINCDWGWPTVPGAAPWGQPCILRPAGFSPGAGEWQGRRDTCRQLRLPTTARDTRLPLAPCSEITGVSSARRDFLQVNLEVGGKLRAGPLVESIARKGTWVRASAQPLPWCELTLNQNFLRNSFPGQGKLCEEGEEERRGRRFGAERPPCPPLSQRTSSLTLPELQESPTLANF